MCDAKHSKLQNFSSRWTFAAKQRDGPRRKNVYETQDGTETRFKVNMCLFLFKKMFETHTPLLLHSFLVYRKQQHPHHEIYP